MPCAVAVANSALFIPPAVVPHKLLQSNMSSPATLSLHNSPGPTTPTSSCPSPSPSSPSMAIRILKQQGGYSGSFVKNDGPIGLESLAAASTLAKRKRPARIEIPIVPLRVAEMMADVDRSDDVADVEEEGEGYWVCCKKGRRGAMEDRFCAVVAKEGNPKQAFFGVFDGHGGAKAAEFAAKNIEKNIMRELAGRREGEIEEAIRDGYLATDAEFLKTDSGGGTCCLTALVRDGRLVVSSAGDCRAVLSRDGAAEALSIDHRASRKDERERIERLGGYVDCCRGTWRLQGSLAVSRGIGDRLVKQWVIAEPESRTLTVDQGCEFLILASDGLWDRVSNQEAVDLVRPFFCDRRDGTMGGSFSGCKKLVELAIRRGSMDDVTAMVVQLPEFIPGTVSQ